MRRLRGPLTVALAALIAVAAPTLGATPRLPPGIAPPPSPRPGLTPAPARRGVPPPVNVAPTLPGAPACPVFPAATSGTGGSTTGPVAANSAAMIATIGLTRGLHMDFGSYAGYGIPYQVVSAATPRSTVTFEYDDESDHVGYPIPAEPAHRGRAGRDLGRPPHPHGRSRRVPAVRAVRGAQGSAATWHAGSGATWDLRSNALRPAGWTSADAAGLPILPGLVRYDEVAAGAIRHALRFTTEPHPDRLHLPGPASRRRVTGRRRCRRWGCGSASRRRTIPRGLSPHARVIAIALQRYGMILADNGSPWYISGMSDPRFDDDVLHELDAITGSDLEVVDTTGVVNGP